MADNKKSFVAYADWLESFEMLEDAEAGKLIKHLLRYVNDLNPEMEDRLLKVAFQPIKAQLKRDLNKYDEVRKKRIEAGRKGGKKRASQANAKSDKQSKANQAVNVNENVTVNDTVNVNERESKLSSAPSLAFDLLKSKKTTELQSFEMQNKKQVEKWEDLIDNFNDTAEIEISKGKIEFEADQLMPRFRKYTRSWINNQNKYSKTPEPDSYESGKLKRF